VVRIDKIRVRGVESGFQGQGTRVKGLRFRDK